MNILAQRSYIYVFVFAAILSFSYILVVVPEFAYTGFYSEISWARSGVALLSLLLACWLIELSKTSFDYSMSMLIVLFFVIPSAVVCMFMEDSVEVAFLSLSVLIVYVVFSKTVPLVRIRAVSSKGLLLGLAIAIPLMLLPVLFAYGFRVNTDLSDIFGNYELRYAAREQATAASSYSYFNLAKVICPISLVLAYESRNRVLAAISIVTILYLFSVTGHKSAFFALPLTGLFYFLGKDYRSKTHWLFIILSSAIVVGVFIYYVFGSSLIVSMVARRALLVPALLNIYYKEFIDSVGYLYFSTSFLSPFISYPLELPLPLVIGMEYFSSANIAANNGVVSDGYAQLGPVGVVISSIIAAAILSQLRAFPARYFGVFVVTLFAVAGSAITTVLLTHGGFVLLLFSLVVVFPEPNRDRTRRTSRRIRTR